MKKPYQTYLAGWVGVIALLGFILIHVFTARDKPTTAHSTSTNSNENITTQSAFEAAAYLGAVDGMADYNNGSLHRNDEQLDSNARRLTANMKFDAPTGRDDAIAGYKSGYDIGWNQAKKQ